MIRKDLVFIDEALDSREEVINFITEAALLTAAAPLILSYAKNNYARSD